MTLLPILLAGLTDAVLAVQRQARLQELRGRLGVLPQETGGDLRSRVRWIFARHQDPNVQWTMVHAFLHLVEPYQHQEHRLYEARTGVWWRTLLAEMGSESLQVGDNFETPRGQVHAIYVADATKPVPERWLPDPGMQASIAPLLPWIAREITRFTGREMAGEDPYALVADNAVVRDPRFLQRLHAGRPLTVNPYAVALLLSALQHEGFEDWVEAERPDLFRFTAEEAVAAAWAWHHQFTTADMGGVALPGVVVAELPDGGTIQRLLTKAQLESEGETMGHCIGGSYDPKETVYLSLRNAEGTPLETAQISDVEPYAVRQHVGPGNATPSRKSAFSMLLTAWGRPTEEEYVRARRSSLPMLDIPAFIAAMAPYDARLMKRVEDLRMALVQGSSGFIGDIPGPMDALWRSTPKIEEAWTGLHQDVAFYRAEWANTLVREGASDVGYEDPSSFSISDEADPFFVRPYVGFIGGGPPWFTTAWLHGEVSGGLRLGWASGAHHALYPTPTAYFLAKRQIVSVAAYVRQTARLEKQWKDLWTKKPPTLYTQGEICLPWKDFVALALRRSAWPAGQKVPTLK